MPIAALTSSRVSFAIGCSSETKTSGMQSGEADEERSTGVYCRCRPAPLSWISGSRCLSGQFDRSPERIQVSEVVVVPGLCESGYTADNAGDEAADK
jgi:hypothetical protein